MEDESLTFKRVVKKASSCEQEMKNASDCHTSDNQKSEVSKFKTEREQIIV